MVAEPMRDGRGVGYRSLWTRLHACPSPARLPSQASFAPVPAAWFLWGLLAASGVRLLCHPLGGGGRTLTLPPLSRERWALVLGLEQVSVSQCVPAPSLLTTRRWLVDEK